ncbi:hypothetical protein K435DRAFT_802859 [Dendrothele bispora CBS 962.96]|uniref:Uncharacterized protein n=1 Tax=Dendrothele bispora (strain CBS 962.96) TaxID=1314807 RepID=A0A4S8LJC6_DENBC|nr:hypothetical protein K435DRAFT_802859 [Dendrothele bispora CBS 962.96]
MSLIDACIRKFEAGFCVNSTKGTRLEGFGYKELTPEQMCIEQYILPQCNFHWDRGLAPVSHHFSDKIIIVKSQVSLDICKVGRIRILVSHRVTGQIGHLLSGNSCLAPQKWPEQFIHLDQDIRRQNRWEQAKPLILVKPMLGFNTIFGRESHHFLSPVYFKVQSKYAGLPKTGNGYTKDWLLNRVTLDFDN